ncbi:porin OmpU, partial [Streptococcus suis]
GRAEARLSLKDGKADDLSRVRLNFLGKSMITDSLYGVGFYEGEFTTADNGDGSDLDNRYTYAGIGGNFGEVTYGKNDGALGVITDFTDIMA